MVNQLTVDSIVKLYGNKAILTDIAFSCKTGEIVGLFGRNGSGKTTLLNIIYGTLQSDNKYLAINGIKTNLPFSLKKTLNYLPQDSFIPKYLTVRKVIKLFLEESEKKSLLEDEVITSIANKKIKDLSFGDLRYLEIRLILSSSTKFSILDEPFQGQAPLRIEKIQKLILHASKNKGIILVDHSYTSVLNLATKLYILCNTSLIPIKNQEELIHYGYLK